VPDYKVIIYARVADTWSSSPLQHFEPIAPRQQLVELDAHRFELRGAVGASRLRSVIRLDLLPPIGLRGGPHRGRWRPKIATHRSPSEQSCAIFRPPLLSCCSTRSCWLHQSLKRWHRSTANCSFNSLQPIAPRFAPLWDPFVRAILESQIFPQHLFSFFRHGVINDMTASRTKF